MLNNIKPDTYKLYVLEFDKDFKQNNYVAAIHLIAIFEDFGHALRYANLYYDDCDFYIVDPDGHVLY